MANIIWAYEKRELIDYALSYDNQDKIYITGVKIPKGNLNNYADGFRLFINPKDGNWCWANRVANAEG